MSFSEQLFQENASLWEKILNHPFLGNLGEGSLPPERFRFYLTQDYLFLVDYCRVLALATAKSRDLDTMGGFVKLLHGTLQVEMSIHRRYAARFGLQEGDLSSAERAPATMAYTRHLLAVAYGGNTGEIAAALLPCQWSYWEIAGRLRQRPAATHPLYGDWVNTYGSAEYRDLARWIRNLVDHHAEGLPNRELEPLRAHFLAGCRYEIAFWTMAEHEEAWPISG